MRKAAAAVIRIGIGGWTYEPWRGSFYPADLVHTRELEYASRQLTSIEINGTYYGAQKASTFANWRDATPAGFVFSVKAPRYAMNRKVLASAGSSISRFLEGGVTELKDKLGPINWQFLPTKKFEPDDFKAFLELLPRESGGRPLRHVVEVRHESFRCEQFVALAHEHEAGIVIAADSKYPQIADLTAPFVYVRLMGTRATQKLGYSDADLQLWAARMQTWASGEIPSGFDLVSPTRAADQPRDVYLYVIGGHKVSNPAAASALIERLG